MPRPGIARACFLIALDNGGINRDRSEKRWQKDYARWIERQAVPNLIDIDNWLFSRSDDDLELICCGGEGEPETVTARADAPPFTDDILNSYFDEVC